MDVEARAELHVSPARAHRVLADLATYPDWLGIVQAVSAAPPDPADPGPSWVVDLGVRLGPLRRTKRVRMVRTACEAPRLVRFERSELDGRAHPDWVLTARLASGDASERSQLTMDLHYGGSRSLPIADVVLAAEIRRAGGRLDDYLQRGS